MNSYPARLRRLEHIVQMNKDYLAKRIFSSGVGGENVIN